MYPPIPAENILIDPIQIPLAMAESTALPPSCNIFIPMFEQISNSVATAPCFAWTKIFRLLPGVDAAITNNFQKMNANTIVTRRTMLIHATITFRLLFEKFRHRSNLERGFIRWSGSFSRSGLLSSGSPWEELFKDCDSRTSERWPGESASSTTILGIGRGDGVIVEHLATLYPSFLIDNNRNRSSEEVRAGICKSKLEKGSDLQLYIYVNKINK